MKGIARTARRLMLVFLALVASSMMFFSFPAVAATSSATLLTPDNFETEVVKSAKPVIVILAPELVLKGDPNFLENLKTKAEQVYGDKYKVITGKNEENFEIDNRVSPPGFPIPKIAAYKSGFFEVGIPLGRDATQSFESVKTDLEKA